MNTEWQAKELAEEVHEGYADVDYGDVWSLDERLADIISKHLLAFLKAEKGPNGGCPRIIVNEVGEEKAHESWLQMIRKMIYAFDEYQSVPDKFNIEPDKEDRIRESMLYLDDCLDNWNEMLDKEMTKDMHLVYPFHTFFTDMDFSIYDLLWVRDFNIEITTESDYDSYPEGDNKYDDIDWNKFDYYE